MDPALVQTFSSAVQAGAAVLQAGVAIALFVITKRYVQLTDRLAKASELQVEVLRADRDQARTENLNRLSALARSLDARLVGLPDDTPNGRQTADGVLRRAIVPTEEELQDLRRLAGGVGPQAAALGNSAADEISAIARVLREIQGTPIERGYEYRRFDWARWAEHRGRARAALAPLIRD